MDPAHSADPAAQTLWLVVNAASGSNSDASVAALNEALERAGHSPARTICFPSDDLPDGAALDAAGVVILAIYTGDGTINSQVTKLIGWGGKVLILPGGTQNLLARRIHGDADPAEIARRLGAGELVSFKRPAVETSVGCALVEVVAGPGAMWAEVREGMRDMDLPAIATAIGDAVRETAGGALVHVDVPPLGRRSGYRAVRVDAHCGALTLDGYDAQDIGEVAQHAATMLLKQDFRPGPHEELGQAPRVLCRSDAPMALMLDGELHEGTTEESFEAITLAVNFLGHPDCAGIDHGRAAWDVRHGMTRVFHLSDIHFGLEDVRALDWVVDCVKRERPDAVAITGDLTMRARHEEFAAACRWITALNVPVTVEVGNHDLPYFNLAERFLDPYRRFRSIEALVEREIPLPGAAIVPLKTTARAQWRLDWSKGWVGRRGLAATLAAIDALPAGTRALVTCHHPLVEAGTRGKALTRGGEHALSELARRNVMAVLSGHVHDAFDLVHPTANGPVRMIGAGTLSKRVRSTPPGFNELTFADGELKVRVRNLAAVPTTDMQIDDVPPDAMPPRQPGEPVAPVGAVPAVDPPVH